METSETSPSPEGSFFELVSFLVSSARGAPEEGVYTASLRLIEAAGRLAALGAEHESDEFLRALSAEIRAGATTSYLESSERYLAFLDRVLSSVATEVRHRNELEAR
jgi:hypothetical protein